MKPNENEPRPDDEPTPSPDEQPDLPAIRWRKADPTKTHVTFTHPPEGEPEGDE